MFFFLFFLLQVGKKNHKNCYKIDLDFSIGAYKEVRVYQEFFGKGHGNIWIFEYDQFKFE